MHGPLGPGGGSPGTEPGDGRVPSGAPRGPGPRTGGPGLPGRRPGRVRRVDALLPAGRTGIRTSWAPRRPPARRFLARGGGPRLARRGPRAPVVLAGHSTGAQVACRVAAARPERVRSLVLMSPVFPPAVRRVTGLLRALPGTLAHESPGEIRVTAPYFLRAGRDLHRYLRSALREAPERLVDRVACPVLVVRGEHDALSPQPWVSELAARAPRGRWVTVPGAHNFPYRRGGLTSALIAEAARHR
ncbi:alpha/beta fold hydrolase [Streptomyces capoamus]|uniref:alpha/beta fold hydrolase n=1 Tax=Streptomyces capoamus TaxID=68183 RepID=UPI003C2F3618